MGRCYIVGAGDFTDRDLNVGADDLLIAADGGYAPLQAANIKPDLLVGDFDSLDKRFRIPEDIPVKRYPVMKDDTDTGLALREGWERGCRDFALYGASGGRVDHLLANIASLCRYARLGATTRLIAREYDLFTVCDGTLVLPNRPCGSLVSVFCHGERSSGVTLNGLLYPLTDAVLTGDFPLGVSNQTIGTQASVTVASGVLYVIAYLQNGH